VPGGFMRGLEKVRIGAIYDLSCLRSSKQSGCGGRLEFLRAALI